MDEVLASILMVLVFAGAAMAVYYIALLTGFFKELRAREPDVWRSIGSPTLLNMLLLPFLRFKKYYAFLPILKARRDCDYKYARRAWNMLIAGLMYCVLLAVMVLLLAASVLL